MKTDIYKRVFSFDKARRIILSLVVFSVIAILSGCANSNPSGPSGSPATVEGKVSGSNSSAGKMFKSTSTESGVQGATVILAMVKANGTLQTVSKAAVQTDINGKFDVETDLSGISNLVVIATQGTQQWKAVVTSQVQSGLKVYSEPLDDQTTIKTNLFIKAKENNDGNVTYAEIENYVSSGIASEIESDSSMENEVEASINAEANAEAEAASNSALGITQAQWNSVVNGEAEAEASLERNLYYANNQSDDDAAHSSYFQGMVNAYLNAGLSADMYIKVLEISERVFLNSTANLNAQVAFSFEQRAEYIKAVIMNYAVQSSFTALGASQAEMNDAINAGVTLATSIKSATSASDINNAYTTYQSTIEADMSVMIGINSSMMSNMDSNLAGYRSTLQAAVTSNASATSVVNAYAAFYASVKAEMTSVMGVSNAARLNAAANVMMILYASF